ncbi:hypothetical protein [Actinomadura macrotermitis]|uniref:Uncharacterized protein n=1 Tax=Actinomadura macrotermitis TaxID=2585200 RepID=A0A7K0C3R2_9ACTN|nr:hypothetical protein [Actinomadura macrotermitis]MQY08058.1 hypothetical protein [Actinomadura macrotermitis]
MILVLASIIAVFLGGIICGIFAMLVIGIHAEERRITRAGTGPTRTGAISRRVLSTQTCDDLPERVKAGR